MCEIYQYFKYLLNGTYHRQEIIYTLHSQMWQILRKEVHAWVILTDPMLITPTTN